MYKIILASQSPRRRQILERLSVPFEVIPSGAKEYMELEQTTNSNIKALENRLKELLKNPNTPTIEIKDIAYSIEVLEKRLKK